MRKVLIVDDETIVRVTLRSMVRWEEYGMQVAADCQSGYQALEYLREHPVDLLVTDVKMPEMSGIELLRRLTEEGRMPLTLMLSGYNEFELVREAFRLGACDYILKADLTPDSMGRILKAVNERYFSFTVPEGYEKQETGEEPGVALPQSGVYGTAVLEVDDFQRQAARFGEDLKEMLEKPMLELANQIPRVSRRAKLTAVQPGHYLFLYQVSDRSLYRQEVLSVIRQMQAVWRDYMNLTVSAAVCDPKEAGELHQTAEKCEGLLGLAPLGGCASITTEWERGDLLEGLDEAADRYRKLLSCLYEADEEGFEREKQECFLLLEKLEPAEAAAESLRLVALLARKFREYEEDFFSVFPEEINYYEKISRLPGTRELELWLNNYLRWEYEYLENRLDNRQADTILRAKRFIGDNYANPELTLKSVADYVGLNEKYFTTRFTKETGSNFRNYLTALRLSRAKKLMETTDLKMYEISERVGYNNVEHFNRMFKKSFGISPSDYKKIKN
ncbi:MAG: response regulator [Candidatus Limivivens sp.]|nr:response regulator [Candidatus Limivivens sp.]